LHVKSYSYSYSYSYKTKTRKTTYRPGTGWQDIRNIPYVRDGWDGRDGNEAALSNSTRPAQAAASGIVRRAGYTVKVTFGYTSFSQVSVLETRSKLSNVIVRPSVTVERRVAKIFGLRQAGSSLCRARDVGYVSQGLTTRKAMMVAQSIRGMADSMQNANGAQCPKVYATGTCTVPPLLLQTRLFNRRWICSCVAVNQMNCSKLYQKSWNLR
jgi:hypothetical protein